MMDLTDGGFLKSAVEHPSDNHTSHCDRQTARVIFTS